MPLKRPSSDQFDANRPHKVSGALPPAANAAVKKLQRACKELQLSSLPRVMTGREEERDEIYTALRSSIEQQSAGGPIYISGLPGAGKTSIVKEVIRMLEAQRDSGKLRNFAWVEVNGLQMPRPDVAYTVLWKALHPPTTEEEDSELQPSRANVSAARRCEILQREFHTKSSTRPMLLVLLDEMDFMLAGKNQSDCQPRSAVDWVATALPFQRTPELS
ncbi:hypothetical protein PInf_012446 [Phytophthora infestans]|nr:hypothetical protein PInf_012446 [Phytophthora infestans]